jgi:hypothetical protein
MSWWWQDMHNDNVYPLFAGMSEILRSAGWQEGAWTPVGFAGDNQPPSQLGDVIPEGETFNAQIALNAFRRLGRKMLGELSVADRLSADRAAESLSGYLRGSKEANLQRSIKLTAFLEGNAKLAFRVKSVASDVGLVVKVDGSEALRTNFIGGAATAARPKEINEDFTINLPSGKRVIEIANDGGVDWILIESLRLERVRPAEFAGGWKFTPESVGLRNTNKAVLYVYSPQVVYPAGALRYNPPLQTGQSVKLADWPAGKYNAQWFDTRSGKVVGTTQGATDGAILTLPVPNFNDDLAAIVTPQ